MNKKYWNSHLKKMQGYTYGLQPEMTETTIKLNTNESPYPPSPAALEAIRSAAGSSLRLYPKAQWDGLRDALSSEYGMEEDSIFCSNGSDEFLSLLFRTFADPGDAVLLTDPTYSLYPVLARSQGIGIKEAPCGVDFRMDFEQIAAIDARITILTNPNAPTGILEPLEALEEFIASRDGLVVVDEAYIDFADDPKAASALQLVSKFDNLLVARTFSKSFSLCGIRAGYAFGNPDLIFALMTAKDSYNLDALAQAAAEAAVRDIGWMRNNAAKVTATRKKNGRSFAQAGIYHSPVQCEFSLRDSSGE